MPLKVKAGAKTSCIHGFVDVNGSYLLKISIKAPPEDGKANTAIIKMLADKWGLRQNQLEIVKGTTNSTKMMAIKEVDIDIILKFAEQILRAPTNNK